MTKEFGKNSEDFVAAYLVKQGFVIIQRNYKKFFGEIDIIARRGNILAFVEVKARKEKNSLLHELVTPKKQNKIAKVARLFISTFSNDFDDLVYRFDVALVSGIEGKQDITYISNAYVA